MESTIEFYSEEISFEVPEEEKIKQWIDAVIQNHGKKSGDISFIFCDDEYLHQINVQYLDHDTLTDIITFDNSDEEDVIEGDIFVSVDRVNENAKSFETTFDNELKRVIIHGILHLLGFKDKSDEEAQNMRDKEDESLAIFNKIQ
ncbi:rRNA maturation RNase YbeY [Aureibacter tunicatorum]|uniref:Endoribonuclease YbeY n=1 Tax=Aureibacter tunicatorum TaxID=866807 RepID=A0AAE3XH14_9BACT|nr:rRNA maturation RNase YbeY [Aureibacter tunicatorum]MDR6237486.1 rRNA maturation RNase YbeY [Aureibacter tunicatorum]BDD02520.1 endoribonuclease YbeY [Aureibacter tunicatorum]